MSLSSANRLIRLRHTYRTYIITHFKFCRGIVTADVLELGLSRGAIATRKLEGVNVGQGTRGFILVRPLTVKVKAYVQSEVVLIRVTITRELKLLCPALDEIVLVLKLLSGRPLI